MYVTTRSLLPLLPLAPDDIMRRLKARATGAVAEEDRCGVRTPGRRTRSANIKRARRRLSVRRGSRLLLLLLLLVVRLPAAAFAPALWARRKGMG